MAGSFLPMRLARLMANAAASGRLQFERRRRREEYRNSRQHSDDVVNVKMRGEREDDQQQLDHLLLSLSLSLSPLQAFILHLLFIRPFAVPSASPFLLSTSVTEINGTNLVRPPLPHTVACLSERAPAPSFSVLCCGFLTSAIILFYRITAANEITCVRVLRTL